MTANALHFPIDHSASVGIRRGIAIAVVLLHALVVVAIWWSRAVPVVEASGQTVMVSFVDAAQENTAVPPQPPVTVQEPAPIIATARQTPAASAPVPTPVITPSVTSVSTATATPATSSVASFTAAEPSTSANVSVSAEPSLASVVTPPSFGASYLNNPKPFYPLASRRLGEEGITMLRVQVSAEGVPQQIQVERSSGSSRLDMAAQKAVRDWRFVPAREGSMAVAGWVNVPINWKLDN